MLGKFPNNLKEAMQEKGLGPTALGRLVGRSRQNIDRWAKGQRRLTPEVAKELAEHLDVSWDELLIASEDSPPEMIPVVGSVGAGGEASLYGDADAPDDFIPAPEGSSEHTVAVLIRGGSLGELFDRWFAVYDNVRSPITDDLIGELCVVGLSDRRVLIKKVRRSATPGLFHLVSQTEGTITDVAIDWAAKVKTLVSP